MEQMQAEIAVMKRMITEIHHVVIGSEHDLDMGLLKRVKDLEERTDKQEKLMNRVTYIAIGMSIPASWGVLQIVLKIVGINF